MYIMDFFSFHKQQNKIEISFKNFLLIQEVKSQFILSYQMNQGYRLLIGMGLIIMGLLLSGVLAISSFQDVIIFTQSIFQTNCNLTFSPNTSCSNIFTAINAAFIVSGIFIILLFNLTTALCSSFTLILFALLYSNPKIDSNFISLLHFVEICACASGIIYLANHN